MSPPHVFMDRVTEREPRFCRTRRLLRVFAPVAVLACGLGLAVWLIRTAPTVDRRPAPIQARLVEVVRAQFGLETVRVTGMGLVLPSREVTLHPRISGEVIRIAEGFVPGSRFEAGAILLEIDPSDFRLALTQRESELMQAQSALVLEEGQQAVARKEFELLGREIAEADRDLILRQPQLRQARARVQAAEAALEQARLNLERTLIRAPFNCVVRERLVHVGSLVGPATPLATLAGTDEYWVEVTVPVDQLPWLFVPHWNSATGSVARIWRVGEVPPGAARQGRILKLLPDLEQGGRLARLLVVVTQPWTEPVVGTNLPPLLLGDSVRVELEGRVLRAVPVDRRWCRDGDHVWIMNDRDELEIRSVTVAFRGPETLLVTDGLREGDRIVVSELSAAVPGLPLRVSGEGESVSSPRESTVSRDGAGG
ncbi:MAG: efflux RND transporter periplasmic adaptor subunit [Verrucomicrobiota bacterium]|nr:efflux RND transporter periplasmic adaptor subunit [Limisphaera sp.]MDW8381959.1 efflux RND transporter periplasmic adaptor subunit [Verrucomicrobiota bacterium]